jgi:hypothetical protein
VLAVTVPCAGGLLGGCGSSRQDAHEANGTFTLKVLKASFPARQTLVRPTRLELQVKNTGAHTAPNVAVTIDSFYYTEKYPELASNKRPIWVIESGPGRVPSRFVESQTVSPPGGAQTNYVSTWALGPLAPGHTATFIWHVAPLKPGTHTIHYTIAAGLAGKAKAQLASGRPVQGRLTAQISSAPPLRHVNPATGRVEPGAAPAIP